MQILDKVDLANTETNYRTPDLFHGNSSNTKNFSELLQSTIETNYEITGEALENNPSPELKVQNEVPSWVDPDYIFDPLNPRKPNMRELVEALSGKNIEDLYNGSVENWQKISNQASEVLYGVVGSNEDKRDWQSIMSSENILEAARKETGAFYEPKVDIITSLDPDGTTIKQQAVIKDKKGVTLRDISNDITLSEETLKNFGATKDSIPIDLEDRVNLNMFDKDLFMLLKNFDQSPSSLDQMVAQSISENIVNNLKHEISLDEMAKL